MRQPPMALVSTCVPPTAGLARDSASVWGRAFFRRPQALRPGWAIPFHNKLERRLARRCRCDAGSAGDGGPSGKDGRRQGNEEMQELLTDIVRLQTGRQEVEEFAAQKAALLTDLAKGATEDLERIAQGASEGMEAANAKIMEAVDSQVSELEKELAAARLEQEKRDKEFDEFEKQLIEKRNEGLFFKSLYRKEKRNGESTPRLTKEEVLKANPELASATKNAAKSPMRRNLYGVFALLAGLTLGKAITDEAPLSSILACAAVCVALVFQVVYEMSLAESE